MKENVNVNPTGDWLENAIPLDPTLSSIVPEIKELVEQILPDLIESILNKGILKKPTTKKNLIKLKQSVKNMLLNLCFVWKRDLPVRYSRDIHWYTKDKRYGQCFMKYRRTMAVVQALSDNKYIDEYSFFNDRKKGIGRQSRICASPKLIKLFNNYKLEDKNNMFEKEERDELIELRDEEKNSISYKDNNTTNLMRKNLAAYNDFTNEFKITVKLDESVQISLDNLNRIYADNIISNIKISIIKYTSNISNNISSNNSNNIYYNIPSSIMTHNKNGRRTDSKDSQPIYDPNYDSQKEYNKAVYLSLLIKNNFDYNKKITNSKKDFEKRNLEKHSLSYFGIQSIEFEIESKKLYRVFNESKKFNRGGRHYGGYYQRIPKEFRDYIWIDNKRVTELDFSALHPRMCYHLADINYGKGDIYQELIENEEEEKKIYKLIVLTALNANNQKEAIQGFRLLARKNGFNIDLKDSYIKGLINKFKDVHKPISNYIYSGVGLELQYLDSKITEKILMRLVELKIPSLPVFDSYIVPAQYEDKLREIMIEAYEDELGFEPVIK